MARLLLCGWVTGMSGCLIPQDDQVLPELPPMKNRPPRVAARVPASDVVEHKQSAVPQCLAANATFSLTVEDPDTGDTLRSFWFVEKDETSLPFTPQAVPPGTSEARIVAAPTSNAFTTALANLQTGRRLLTVYVADRDIEEINNGEIRPVDTEVTLPDGTTATNPGYFVQHTWVLEVVPCP